MSSLEAIAWIVWVAISLIGIPIYFRAARLVKEYSKIHPEWATYYMSKRPTIFGIGKKRVVASWLVQLIRTIPDDTSNPITGQLHHVDKQLRRLRNISTIGLLGIMLLKWILNEKI